jgi:hypothetical protein
VKKTVTKKNGAEAPPTATTADTTTRLERIIVSIEQLEQTELSDRDRAHLRASAERWKVMRSGRHLKDWLDFLPDLQNGRMLAMRCAGTNRPEGRGYAEAFSSFLNRWFPTMDKNAVSHLLWLGEEGQARLEALEGVFIRNPSLRTKINAPQSARKVVEREIREVLGTVPKVKSDKSDDKREALIREQGATIARMDAKLANAGDGSLFKWSKGLRDADYDMIARILIESGPMGGGAAKLAKAILKRIEEIEASRQSKHGGRGRSKVNE